MPPRTEVLPLPVGSQAKPSCGAKFRVRLPDGVAQAGYQSIELRNGRIMTIAAARSLAHSADHSSA